MGDVEDVLSPGLVPGILLSDELGIELGELLLVVSCRTCLTASQEPSTKPQTCPNECPPSWRDHGSRHRTTSGTTKRTIHGHVRTLPGCLHHDCHPHPWSVRPEP